MEHESKSATMTIIGALLFIAAVAIVVTTLESARKADLVLSQMKEMRQSMEDAGYVAREPKITESR